MRKPLIISAIIALVALSAWLIYEFQKPNYRRFYYHYWNYTPSKYKALKTDVANKKAEFQDRYAAAQDDLAIVKPAIAAYLTRSFDEQFAPFWYGTSYNFYGTTTTPGRGKIACGYFVTTVLSDMGVPLNRVALAECASEKMILALVAPTAVKRFSKAPIETFVKSIRDSGEGLYLTGLDTHTGFILNRNNRITFIHSSGRYPFCVLSEDALSSIALGKSAYRVLAKITDDDVFITNWLVKS